MMVAHPKLQASRLVLPKGSSHLEQATEILDFFKRLRTKLLPLKLNECKFLCLKICFSRGSSPTTIDFQSGNSSSILIIDCPNISYPFAELSFPTKVIFFFFLF